MAVADQGPPAHLQFDHAGRHPAHVGRRVRHVGERSHRPLGAGPDLRGHRADDPGRGGARGGPAPLRDPPADGRRVAFEPGDVRRLVPADARAGGRGDLGVAPFRVAFAHLRPGPRHGAAALQVVRRELRRGDAAASARLRDVGARVLRLVAPANRPARLRRQHGGLDGPADRVQRQEHRRADRAHRHRDHRAGQRLLQRAQAGGRHAPLRRTDRSRHGHAAGGTAPERLLRQHPHRDLPRGGQGVGAAAAQGRSAIQRLRPLGGAGRVRLGDRPPQGAVARRSAAFAQGARGRRRAGHVPGDPRENRGVLRLRDRAQGLDQGRARDGPSRQPPPHRLHAQFAPRRRGTRLG